MSKKKLLPSKSEFPAEWYSTVLRLADLTDYGPAKGTMIIKPYGYALWENVQNAMNPLMKEKGVGNSYFPLLIPFELLQKEADHIEGFSPELAIVTHAGGEKLEEPLVVRPTSETIMYSSYSKWIQSWRDLPLMMNQWNNVVRWEKRTTPFLRTSEFLWQEGHTAHATLAEAVDMQIWAMDMYKHIYHDLFAIDGYVGLKSTAERFSGAMQTLTYEALMPSGKALQAATSHNLGQNFSKPFEISFQTTEGQEDFVWQTSWGFSTRSLGALILAHGDDDGLVLPPHIAPIQAVIITIGLSDREIAYASDVLAALKAKGVRAEVDLRDDERFGFKMNKWEVKGVPIIITIGGNEIDDNVVSAKARVNKEVRSLAKDQAADEISVWLENIHTDMLTKSSESLKQNTRQASNYDEFKAVLSEHKGFVEVFWNDNPETEEKIKSDTKASSRCMLVTNDTESGTDFYTGEPSSTKWLFAQSY